MSSNLCIIMLTIPTSGICAFSQRFPKSIQYKEFLIFWLQRALYLMQFMFYILCFYKPLEIVCNNRKLQIHQVTNIRHRITMTKSKTGNRKQGVPWDHIRNRTKESAVCLRSIRKMKNASYSPAQLTNEKGNLYIKNSKSQLSNCRQKVCLCFS